MSRKILNYVWQIFLSSMISKPPWHGITECDQHDWISRLDVIRSEVETEHNFLDISQANTKKEIIILSLMTFRIGKRKARVSEKVNKSSFTVVTTFYNNFLLELMIGEPNDSYDYSSSSITEASPCLAVLIAALSSLCRRTLLNWCGNRC